MRVDCPSCQTQTKVLETRAAEDGAVRRRRRCPSCDRRFTTFERREPEPVFVIKRGGSRQRFDRAKLRAGLGRAAHKRPVHSADLDALAQRIESEIEDSGGEASAEEVRQMCLDGLGALDTGAFLQFAGVELSDLDSVRAALGRLDRKDRDFSPLASVSSVRGGEDAPRPTPDRDSRARGDR